MKNRLKERDEIIGIITFLGDTPRDLERTISPCLSRWEQIDRPNAKPW